MSGNGSRTRSRYYGTTGNLLPTPRSCSGLRSSGANQTELMMTAERLDYSHADTHVSHFRSPGSAWARRMTAISGRSLLRWLPNSNLNGCLQRMFTDTSRWGSTRCWLTWSRSATPAGRSLFRLRPSAPRTGEIASGFWPTPKAQEDGRSPEAWEIARQRGYEVRKAKGTSSGGPASKHGSLSVMVKMVERGMLPTPRHEGFDAGGHRGTTDSLHSHVKMFPTPRAIYGEHAGMSDPSHLTGAAGASPTTGKLSAAWVGRMMGFPDGWLDVDGIPDLT